MLENNRIPINKQAALIIAKAPWWAQPIEHQKKELKKIAAETKIKIDLILNITQPPNNKDVKDLRGRKKNGLTIIGYADTKEMESGLHNSGHKKPPFWCGDGWDPKKCSKGIKKMRFWWVVDENGEIKRMAWRTIKNLHRIKITNKICKGCINDSRIGCSDLNIKEQLKINTTTHKPDCYKQSQVGTKQLTEFI